MHYSNGAGPALQVNRFHQRSKKAEKMVLRASRPASRLTAVVEVLCYHGGHSDELEGGQVLQWKMGRDA
ncbi:unnamed protein product [Malus baccata var. baccata]